MKEFKDFENCVMEIMKIAAEHNLQVVDILALVMFLLSYYLESAEVSEKTAEAMLEDLKQTILQNVRISLQRKGDDL